MRKFLRGYLMVSSVVLHVALLCGLIWLVPNLRSGMAMARQFQNPGPETQAQILDVSRYSEGENSYVGYAVKWKGQKLYLMGTDSNVKAGDTVNLMVQKHPYGPTKSLIIVVLPSHAARKF